MRTCRPLTPGPGVLQSRAPTTRHLPDETPPPARGPPAPSSLAAQRPASLSARQQVCGPRHVSPSEAGMPGALWAGVPPPAPTSSAAGQGPRAISQAPRAVSRETSRLGGGPLGLRQTSPPRQDGQSGGTPADHLPSRLQVLGGCKYPLSLSGLCPPSCPCSEGRVQGRPSSDTPASAVSASPAEPSQSPPGQGQAGGPDLRGPPRKGCSALSAQGSVGQS